MIPTIYNALKKHKYKTKYIVLMLIGLKWFQMINNGSAGL